MDNATKGNGKKKKRKDMSNVEVLTVEMTPELKHLIGQAAGADTLTDYVSRILAREVGRPDLGITPRKGRPGRPRKELGHTNGKRRK